MFVPNSNWVHKLALFACALTIISGCQSNRIGPADLSCQPRRAEELFANTGGPTYLSLDNQPCIDECDPIEVSMSPLDTSDYSNIQHHELTLDQCIEFALRNSKVFRDLGGAILTAPQATEGVYGPALTASDPQFSEEAALSVFDANFSAAAFFQNNDQASNLTFQGNNGIFEQDFHDYRYTLQKLAATGTVFTLSNLYNYDNSNQTGQTLSHTWQTIFQGEFRHPLLQGSGVTFNRIAGPSTQPGVFGGVLIARTNTEISLSQFKQAVRDLISEVENVYWDLYFAYRNLEATIDGRDKAYEILVATTEGKSREGSQAQAQAKEQYLRFEADLLDAMEGRPTFGTRNGNGMTAGVFLSNGGVRVNERRLRLICGLPINGPELLRPVDEPASTGVQFDWQQSVEQAFRERQEIVQQRWLVKQRELQLVAAKNFLLPRFDLIGQYRFRGIGRDLTGGSTSFQDDLNNGTSDSNAFGDLFSGDFQEWQLGAEFSVPLGFRSAHLGVRNAEVNLSRERALLHEQKREIVFGLSNAFGELRRSFASLTAAEEQYVAAREFQFVMKLEVERGRDRDIELEAQRRVVDAELGYRQAQVEYMLALKSIHVEKGTYLDFCNVRLNESASHPKSLADATERRERRGRPMSYVTDQPIIARPKPEPIAPITSVPNVGFGNFAPVNTIVQPNNAPFQFQEQQFQQFDSTIEPSNSESLPKPTDPPKPVPDDESTTSTISDLPLDWSQQQNGPATPKRSGRSYRLDDFNTTMTPSTRSLPQLPFKHPLFESLPIETGESESPNTGENRASRIANSENSDRRNVPVVKRAVFDEFDK